MQQSEKLFENLFDDKNIIPSRLSNFASDTLNNLTANNGGGSYTALISLLTPLITNFQGEIGEVDTSLNIQKGSTLTVDEFIKVFSDTMSSEEPFIARTLGGKGTAAYLEFYPQGVSEYTKPAKINMQTFTDRVNTAATAHAAQLGATLTATLQAFSPNWKNTRDKQQQQMGTVDTNRTERSTNRTALELGLLTAIHTIGAAFPGNVPQCLKFFQFNLLFAQTKHKHKTFGGIIGADKTVEVLNRLFTDTAAITIRNPDDNATIFTWLAATPNETMPFTAIEVEPGKAHDLKPSQLGPLTNPFLLIYNSSEVNEGAWEVEVVG